MTSPKPLSPDDPRWEQAHAVAKRLKRTEAHNRSRAVRMGCHAERVDFLAVVIRWNGCCCICQQEINLLLPGTDADGLTLEHMVSLGQGGRHVDDNVAPAHRRCNLGKNSKIDTKAAAKIKRRRGETGQPKRRKARGGSSIQGRKNPWPKGRKIQSRGFQT